MPTTSMPFIGNGWWQSNCDLHQGDSVSAFFIWAEVQVTKYESQDPEFNSATADLKAQTFCS